MKDISRVGGEIWDKKMVSHSTDAERKNRKAMQREMAQPFEARY